MEFNLEAANTGARLRRGVNRHTLSVGDHDATAMINGTDAELQRLAFDILTATGVIVEQINKLAPSPTTTVNSSLVDRIAAKLAKEVGL